MSAAAPLQWPEGWLCPALGGVSTRLSRKSWDALCASTRAARAGDAWGFLGNGPTLIRKAINTCGECKGQYLPPKLTIIPAAELAAMKQQHREESMAKESCQICGQAGRTLKRNRGKQACPSCHSVIATVANRPEAVANAIKLCGAEQDMVARIAGTAVPAFVESEAIKRIAAAVGYQGEDGEVLVKAVEAMAAARPDCEPCSRLMSEQVDELQAEVERLRGETASAVACAAMFGEAPEFGVLDVARALGIPASTETAEVVWLAAIQTAALLEDAYRATSDLAMLTQAFAQEKERAMGLETYIHAAHEAAGIARDAPLDSWIQSMWEDSNALGKRLSEIRAELGLGLLDDVVTSVRGAVQQARHGRELEGRLAEAQAENERLQTLLEPPHQRESCYSSILNPDRDALADLGRAVIAGQITVAHRG